MLNTLDVNKPRDLNALVENRANYRAVRLRTGNLCQDVRRREEQRLNALLNDCGCHLTSLVVLAAAGVLVPLSVVLFYAAETSAVTALSIFFGGMVLSAMAGKSAAAIALRGRLRRTVCRLQTLLDPGKTQRTDADMKRTMHSEGS